MPRKGKGQAPRAANDQAYGMRNDQMEAQRQIPLPDNRGVQPSSGQGGQDVPPGPAVGTPGTGPAAAAPDPVAALQQAIASGMGPQPGAMMRDPGGGPITAGLQGGPGPGPEALGRYRTPQRQVTAQVLQRIALRTGNGDIARLAQKARNYSAGRM